MLRIAQPVWRGLGRLARAPRAAPAGVALLWCSFFVGCIPVYLGLYPDEGDKLAIGLFMARGSVLYRDLFTHQFPFTYYWVAAVFGLLGPTVLAARLSLLFLQLVCFALLMRLTRATIPVGLAAVGWSATRHLYYGHMVLYNAFAGLALGVVAVIILVVLLSQRGPSRWVWVILGLGAAMALLTDPLALAPLGVGFVFLALSRERWRGLSLVVAVLALVLSGYGAYLALSGTWPDFYRDVVVFNSQVYIKYYDLSLDTYLAQLRGAAGAGLNILLPGTWLVPEAYGPNAHFAAFSQWLFGGFLQRAAVLAFCLLLLRQRHWRAALFTYVFAITLLPRTEVFFRQNAFILFSYLCSGMLLARAWPPAWRWAPGGSGLWPQPPALKLVTRARRWGAWAAAALALWPAVLGLTVLTLHLGAYGYDTNFLDTQRLADKIRAATCGRDVALADYPGDPTLYFFTGLRPVAGYVYLWPWVADVGLRDVIASLSQEEAIVLAPAYENVWGIKTSVYLADLQAYVHAHFVPVGDAYLSPQLAAKCPPPAQP